MKWTMVASVCIIFVIYSVNSTARENLSLEIQGTISSKCQLSLTNDNNIQLVKKEKTTVDFKVDCNLPILITLQSQYGGVKNTKDDTLGLYSLEINVPSISIAESISSKDIKRPKSIDSGDIIPYQTKGEVAISLQNQLIYAGIYEDTLSISVEPKLTLSL